MSMPQAAALLSESRAVALAILGSNGSANADANHSATCSAAVPVGFPIGTVVMVIVRDHQSSTLGTVTDSKGNTYTKRVNGSSILSFALYSARLTSALTAGSDSITYTVSGVGAAGGLAILFAGWSGSRVLTVEGTNNNANQSNGFTTIITGNPQQTNELFIASGNINNSTLNTVAVGNDVTQTDPASWNFINAINFDAGGGIFDAIGFSWLQNPTSHLLQYTPSFSGAGSGWLGTSILAFFKT